MKRNRKITHAIFNRAFSDGASSYRIEKADSQELELAARVLYGEAMKNDPHYGGIVGVLDFEARLVRYDVANTDTRLLCVLDTPLPQRLSHCDLVVSANTEFEPEQKTAFKAQLFNQVKANQFVSADQVTDCNLLDLLPAAMKAA